ECPAQFVIGACPQFFGMLMRMQRHLRASGDPRKLPDCATTVASAPVPASMALQAICGNPRWKRRAAGAALGIAVMVAAGASAPADAIRLDTKDGTRSAIVVPAGPAPAPTVIVLHGATVGAQRTLRGSGFAQAAATRGFVAAFPD